MKPILDEKESIEYLKWQRKLDELVIAGIDQYGTEIIGFTLSMRLHIIHQQIMNGMLVEAVKKEHGGMYL